MLVKVAFDSYPAKEFILGNIYGATMSAPDGSMLRLGVLIAINRPDELMVDTHELLFRDLIYDPKRCRGSKNKNYYKLILPYVDKQVFGYDSLDRDEIRAWAYSMAPAEDFRRSTELIARDTGVWPEFEKIDNPSG